MNKSRKTKTPSCGHFNLSNTCPECIKLFKKWNDKLIASGHNEIEEFSLPEPQLKRNDRHDISRIPLEVIESKRDYYQKCDNFLNSYQWNDKIHKKVWELHCIGLSVREIAKSINRENYGKSIVNQIIQFYQREMA